jgi:hypothetical protein
MLDDWPFESHTLRDLNSWYCGQNERAVVCNHSPCAKEYVFEVEGGVGRLEGVHGEESRPKHFAINRVKNIPKSHVVIFF